MKKILTCGLMALLTLNLFGVEASASMKKRPATVEPAKAPQTPFDKLFKDKKWTEASGFVTLRLSEGKLYLFLPDSMLGRHILVGTAIEGSSDGGYGFAGQVPVSAYDISFTRADSVVYMHETVASVRSDDANIDSALAVSTVNPIRQSFSVKAKTDKGKTSVIDLTPLLFGQNKKLLPVDLNGAYSNSGFVSNTANFKQPESSFTSVYAADGTVSVRSQMTYAMTAKLFGSMSIFTDRNQTVDASFTFALLPEKSMQPRLCDERIGLSSVKVKDFSASRPGSKELKYVCRQNFTDGNRTIYLDRALPESWRKAVAASVAQWNEALKRAGVAGRLQYADFPADTVNFASNNPLCSYVRYAMAAVEPSARVNVDFRSGEILGSTICLPFNLVSDAARSRFVRMAGIDPKARTLTPDEEFTQAVVKSVSGRLLGYTLGILPNDAASSAYPIDSLRDKAFTDRNGICSSITDDVLFNLVADSVAVSRGVKLYNDTLGPYDYYAVDYLYAPLKDAATPEAEKQALNAKITAHQGDPRYFYGNIFYSNTDPRINHDDLSDDLLASARIKIDNAAKMIAGMSRWLAGDDPDYTIRYDLVEQLYIYMNRTMRATIDLAGGIYIDGQNADGKPYFHQDAPARQREAYLASLDLLASMNWADNKAVNDQLFSILSVNTALQEFNMATLIQRIRDLSVNETLFGAASSYTLRQATDDLLAYVSRRLSNGKPLSEFDQKLQIVMTSNLITMAGMNDKSVKKDPSNGSAPAALFLQQTEAVSFSMTPTFNRTSIKYYVAPSLDYLYLGMLYRLRDLYGRMSNSGQTSNREFCNYMRYMIDQVLRTDDVK